MSVRAHAYLPDDKDVSSDGDHRPGPRHATEGTHAARGALAGLSLAILLASLGTSIANVALPTLAQAFDASFQEAQWVVLAYLLASTALIVSVGRWVTSPAAAGC